ncbi:MAG: cell division protein ZapA [Treponema sp.]|nr:cell division protein ZapA [Treponema sp.]
MGKLQIDVLGSSFAIEAKEDDTYLKRLLSYYAEMTGQIEQKSKLKDPLQVSILSGIMLCDELYKEKSKNAQSTQQGDVEIQEAERIAADLIKKIDQVLK